MFFVGAAVVVVAPDDVDVLPNVVVLATDDDAAAGVAGAVVAAVPEPPPPPTITTARELTSIATRPPLTGRTLPGDEGESGSGCCGRADLRQRFAAVRGRGTSR